MPKSQPSHQMELLLPELAFPGRDAVTSKEVAGKLGCDLKHIHRAVEEGRIVAADIGLRTRGAYRITVTSYYAWLVGCLTSMPAENPVLNLETPKLITLFRQLAERLELRGERPDLLINTNKKQP